MNSAHRKSSVNKVPCKFSIRLVKFDSLLVSTLHSLFLATKCFDNGYGHTPIARLSGAILWVRGYKQRQGAGRYRRDQISVTSEGKEDSKHGTTFGN